MSKPRKLMLILGGLTLAISLATGTGTAGAATTTASELKTVQAELESAPTYEVQVIASAPDYQAAAMGTHYDCPLFSFPPQVTCTLYVSWNHTNDLHKSLQGAGPAATATTVGKVICSLIPPLKPVSALCGLAFAGRLEQIKDQLAYAVRTGRCFEVKTTKPQPITLPGQPPIAVISIGTWDTGDKGTDGRVCK